MANKTYTTQGTLLSTTGVVGDGAGMHSLIPFDLVKSANNLVTKCNPHVHFIACADGQGELGMGAPGAAREVLMCQFPVAVPTWSTKMLWTAGVSCYAGSMSTVTVYLSPFEYTGVGGTDGTNAGAFDTLNLTHGYDSSAVSLSVSAGNYGLAEDISDGVSGPVDHSFQHEEGFGRKLVSFAIVTITTAEADGGVSLREFTCWFSP